MDQWLKDEWIVQGSVRLAVRAEQVFDPLPQSRIASARPIEERGPFGRFLDVDGGKENAFGIFGCFGHQRALDSVVGHAESVRIARRRPKRFCLGSKALRAKENSPAIHRWGGRSSCSSSPGRGGRVRCVNWVTFAISFVPGGTFTPSSV
jgi:hypothetical protein